MGPSQGPKRFWLIPPASSRVGELNMDQGRGWYIMGGRGNPLRLGAPKGGSSSGKKARGYLDTLGMKSQGNKANRPTKPEEITVIMDKPS